VKKITCLFVALGSWKRKGIPLLLEAMSILRNQASDCEYILNILGNPGKGEDSLLVPYKDLLEDGTVTLSGYRCDVEPFYRSADILVVASYYEACSLVMLEALRYGLPIITTRVNGADEIVLPGVNGYILPHDAAIFSEHIEMISKNPDLLSKMGLESQLLSDRFSIEQVSKLTETQYLKSILHGGYA
jgi:glycosyltransferase involved in cell wall biosynthesis